MSILGNVLSGKETPLQGLTDSLNWIKAQFAKIVAASPASAAAVTDFETKAAAIEQAGADWVDTAVGPALGQFADEAADLVAKYAPQLIGAGASAALTPAAGVALQALAQVGTAVIQHEVAQLVASQAPASGTAQAPPPQPSPAVVVK